MTVGHAHRDPHRRRRRARAQPVHQGGRQPRRARRATRSSGCGAGGRRCSITTPTTRRPRPSGSSRSTPSVVRTIDRTGGTFLHTSRTNPSRVRPSEVPPHLADRASGEGPFDFTDHALRVVESLGIDALIPIGGDDTLSYALRLHDEGVPVIAIPKTMDNDVHGTDYCIGFSTAVTRGVQFIHNLRTLDGLARADRRRRAVRPLQRRDVADHRLPRRRRPRGHLRGAVRRRPARRAARRGQAREPVELRDGDGLRGRDDRGRRDGRSRARRTRTGTASSAGSASCTASCSRSAPARR